MPVQRADTNNRLTRKLRTGGRALFLLSDPISVSILQLLARRPRGGAELGDRLRNVSRSTRFERLRELEELGVIVREKHAGVPPTTACRLTAAGGRLLPVAVSLEEWLRGAPAGVLALGDPAAVAAMKALALGWGSTLLRWLADQPRSLSELEPLVGDVGYRELERILRNLTEVGLTERVIGRQRLRPYTVTRWARESVVPLAVAVHWERHHIPQHGVPVTMLDIEGGLLLALPLIELPVDLDGACLLLVDTEATAGERIGEVAAEIVDGHLSACAPTAGWAHGERTWVRGTISAWLDALVEGQPAKLQAGCGAEIAGELIVGLRESLTRQSRPIAGRLFETVD
jgi:DNA-binding HxlR family transcriptional regulator